MRQSSMNMDISPPRSSPVRWIVLAWLVTMTSGALAAGLLRLPTRIPFDGALMVLAHGVIAVAMGSAVIGHLVRARPATRLFPAVLVTATFVCGFFAARSFAPVTVGAHATLAAYAALALASTAAVAPSGGPGGRSWHASIAYVGVVLLVLQVALGALLRHHLIGYGWHLLVAGLAALVVLIPSVAISRNAGAAIVEKRAAWSAMISLFVQLLLGVILFLLILAGSGNVSAWLLTTVAHVVAGTITLLAAARLARILRTGR